MFTQLIQNLFAGYLDAGLAAMIFQMLIAFFLGTLFIFKTFWSKVFLFFGRIFGIKKKTDIILAEDLDENIQDAGENSDSPAKDKIEVQATVMNNEKNKEM